MSDVKDLVRRLRDPEFDATDEAADVIEEQAAEIERLRGLERAYGKTIARMVEERDELLAGIERLTDLTR
jgi:DNA repair ATPase RecN